MHPGVVFLSSYFQIAIGGAVTVGRSLLAFEKLRRLEVSSPFHKQLWHAPFIMVFIRLLHCQMYNSFDKILHTGRVFHMEMTSSEQTVLL